MKALLSFVFLAVSSKALAQNDLSVVSIKDTSINLLIYGSEQEPISKKVARLTEGLANKPSLQDQAEHFSKLEFSRALANLGKSSKPKILLLANHASDLNRGGRAQVYSELFKAAGAEVYVLPAGFLAGVPQNQRDSVKAEIVKTFQGVVALDGDDVSPKIYNKYNTHSKNTNYERDLLEADILLAAMKAPGVFTMGIGRGHHLLAALAGLEMFQDISSFLKTKHDHAELDHELGYFSTSNRILLKLLPGLDMAMKVTSRHHQAVVPGTSETVEVAAMSPDGIVEALELKNGEGLSVQFGLEFLPADLRQQFFKKLVELIQSQGVKVQSCESLLSPR